jgi:hypothetical protein
MKAKYSGKYLYEKPETCKLSYDEKDEKCKSRTYGEFAEEVNINNIITKYKATGIMSSGNITNESKPEYGDFGNVDYVETQRKMAKINNAFSNLTAVERGACNNQPELWLSKLQQEAKDKLIADKTEKERIKAQKKADIEKTEAGLNTNPEAKVQTVPLNE